MTFQYAYLFMVIAGFSLFAVALAWASWWSSKAPRSARPAASAKQAAEPTARSAAGAGA